MTVELKQYCPYCSGKIAYPQALAGTATHCPHCRREVELAKDVLQDCRSCGEKMVFSESMVGEQVRCPGCGRTLKLHRPAKDALWRSGNTEETALAKSQFFLVMRGQTEGPFTEAEVCNYIEKDWVRADTRVQMGAGGAWLIIGQVPQFAASFAQQRAPKMAVEEEFTDSGPPEITVQLGDQNYGPYTVGQVRHALKIGSFDGYAKAHRPGMPGWLPLKKWGEFKNLEVVKALGAGSKSSKNQGFPCAIECLLTGLIFWVVALFTQVFSGPIGVVPMGAIVSLCLAAWIWSMCRSLVYPDLGFEEESSIFSAQGMRYEKVIAGIVFWGTYIGLRVSDMWKKHTGQGEEVWLKFFLILVPTGYLLFRGLMAGMLFFSKPEKTISSWIINSIGLLIHAICLLFFLIGFVVLLNAR